MGTQRIGFLNFRALRALGIISCHASHEIVYIPELQNMYAIFGSCGNFQKFGLDMLEERMLVGCGCGVMGGPHLPNQV